MSQQEILTVLEKIKRLIDLKECKNVNYERGLIDKKLIEEIYEEQKGLCWLCKCKTTVPLTHHIQPDGNSNKENLIVLCSLCHKWIHWILKKYLGYRGTAERRW